MKKKNNNKKIVLKPGIDKLSKEMKEAIFLVLNSFKCKYAVRNNHIEIEIDRDNKKEVLEKINNAFLKCFTAIYLIKGG